MYLPRIMARIGLFSNVGRFIIIEKPQKFLFPTFVSDYNNPEPYGALQENSLKTANKRSHEDMVNDGLLDNLPTWFWSYAEDANKKLEQEKNPDTMGSSEAQANAAVVSDADDLDAGPQQEEQPNEQHRILEKYVSAWNEAKDEEEDEAFLRKLVQRPDRIRAKDNEDPVLDLARGYVRERVSRYIWRLAVGNCCALCLEPCTDDTFELAHVHGDGNQERKRSHPHGAEKIEVRDKFLRKEGMERLADGRLVLLCPNCHCRYDTTLHHQYSPQGACVVGRRSREIHLHRFQILRDCRLLAQLFVPQASTAVIRVVECRHRGHFVGMLFVLLEQQAPPRLEVFPFDGTTPVKLRIVLPIVATVALWAQQDDPPARQALHPQLLAVVRMVKFGHRVHFIGKVFVLVKQQVHQVITSGHSSTLIGLYREYSVSRLLYWSSTTTTYCPHTTAVRYCGTVTTRQTHADELMSAVLLF